MKRCIVMLALIFCFFGMVSVAAQDYRFSIPEAEVTVTVEQDGAATIYYKLTFSCAQGARPIDVVDIGMPNLAPHRPGCAAINGVSIPSKNIRVSTYLKPRGSGYEINLANKAIMPGTTGVFEFSAREKAMVWQDLTDPEQASFRFSPTWFGQQYVIGTTRLTLRYKLPIPKADYPAMKDRILWQKKEQEFSAKGVMENEDIASVAWVRNVSLTGPHEFGVSFPKHYVSLVQKDTLVGLVYRWFRSSYEARLIAGIIIIFLFGFVFFPFTGGTGCSVFVVLGVLLAAGMYWSPVFHLALFPVLAFSGLGVILWRTVRKKNYFPAQYCREGGGIKRGLDPVEAAVLLEIPLHQILTMIIFELVKNGVIGVTCQEPLMIELLGSGKGKGVWEASNNRLVRLSLYEQAFIRAFRKQSGTPVEEMDLTEPFKRLIRHVAKSMKGYDAEATREYYRNVVEYSWERVNAESGFEARVKRVEDSLGWLMLDRHWARQIKQIDSDNSYRPGWWHYYPGYRYRHPEKTQPAREGLAAITPQTSTADASFGDVANALSGRFQNLCNGILGELPSVKQTSAGAIDLSSFDNFTTEMLDSLGEAGGSGGHSGGGGCACACACAGCACACACAGGGR